MVLSSVLAMKAVFADGQSMVVEDPTAQQAKMRKRRFCSASRIRKLAAVYQRPQYKQVVMFSRWHDMRRATRDTEREKKRPV